MGQTAKEDSERSFLPLAALVCAFVIVVAVHPARFTGWALWALSPVLFSFVYLLAFRGPPQATRAWVAASLTAGYGALYVVVAGLGDESHTDIARIVYLGLPALGILAVFVWVPIVEIAGALGFGRIERRGGPHPVPAFPAAVALGTLMGGWTILAVTGWMSPRIIVERAAGGPPAPVARLRCEGDDTQLFTPTVIRWPNGIRIHVDNRTGGEHWFEYEVDGGAHGGGGQIIPPGISDHVIRRFAGSIGVVCSAEATGTAADFATIALVDPPASRRPGG